MFRPVMALAGEGESGRHAVQFLARLLWEFGPEGQSLSAKGLQPLAAAALQRLERLLPKKHRDRLRLQLLMAMTNVFHGLADYHYVDIAPFGPRGLRGRGQARLREQVFFDYLEGGLRSGSIGSWSVNAVTDAVRGNVLRSRELLAMPALSLPGHSSRRNAGSEEMA